MAALGSGAEIGMSLMDSYGGVDGETLGAGKMPDGTANTDTVTNADAAADRAALSRQRANTRFHNWLLTKQETLNPYTGRGVYLIIQEKSSGKILYDDTEFTVKGFLFFKDVHLDFSDKEHHIIVNTRIALPVGGTVYELVYSYNMSKDYGRMWRLMLNMSFLYAVIVFFILHEARGQNLRMLTPIQEMSDTINRITVNNLHSERLNLSGVTDELRELAETFNDMLDRLETSYESQKQFVSDASHELRTPIAVVQGYANMLKRWGSKDEAVLEESVEAISSEALQMQEWVEKLLFL
ncbi:MAG: HAMP domain-containing protein [Lachnospiraceae bacterium]|nr:HAMP domain-containing protein [Lachnospiraceae bacterium]